MHLASMESSSPTSRCHTQLLSVKRSTDTQRRIRRLSDVFFVSPEVRCMPVYDDERVGTAAGQKWSRELRRKIRRKLGRARPLAVTWAHPRAHPRAHPTRSLGPRAGGHPGQLWPDQGLGLTCRLPERRGQFGLVVAFPIPEPNLT